MLVALRPSCGWEIRLQRSQHIVLLSPVQATCRKTTPWSPRARTGCLHYQVNEYYTVYTLLNMIDAQLEEYQLGKMKRL